MTPVISLTAPALILAFPALLAAQSSAVVSFTKAQADQGRGVYARACAACHGPQLTDGSAAAVAGPQFREKWSSPARSLHELFSLIRTAMPSGSGAGSLTSDEYLMVTAYLLESNGLSAGERGLTADRATLSSARLPGATTAADTIRFVPGENYLGVTLPGTS